MMAIYINDDDNNYISLLCYAVIPNYCFFHDDEINADHDDKDYDINSILSSSQITIIISSFDRFIFVIQNNCTVRNVKYIVHCTILPEVHGT